MDVVLIKKSNILKGMIQDKKTYSDSYVIVLKQFDQSTIRQLSSFTFDLQRKK